MQRLIKFSDHHHFLTAMKDRYSCFDSNKKNILLIEPYGSTLAFMQRGIENQFNIILLTANKDLRQVPLHYIEAVAMAIEVETANEIQLMALVKCMQILFPLHAVIPGFEYFVPIALRLSRYLNLPNADAVNVMSLRRKDLMRSHLQANNVLVPNFRFVNAMSELETALTEIGYPAICKPVDSAGSVNVKQVTNYQEASVAASRILQGRDILWGHKLSNRVLVEEYIDGKEYSLEGVVHNQRVIHFSITEKWVSDQFEFVEIGHIVNPPIECHLKKRMEKYIEKVIEILGINYCPFHAEIRLNKDTQPVLMEIASRLAGDRIGELIYHATGVNYYDYCYAAYLNEDLPFPVLDSFTHAGIRFFYRPLIDAYTHVTGVEKVKAFPVEDFSLYYSANQAIPVFPKALRRLGHVIIKSADYLGLAQMLDEIDHCIKFVSY